MKLKNKPSKNVIDMTQSVVQRYGKGDRQPNQSLGGGYKEEPMVVAKRLAISKAYQKKVSK